MRELDEIDRRILRELQRDGRMSNADLARRVGLTTATCHRRLRRLFQDGVVRGVRAEIDPKRVGRGTLVSVGVELDRPTPESVAAFETAVSALPFVLDCYRVTGGFDILLKVRVRDMEEFNQVHGEQLIALPGVSRTRSFVAMGVVVENGPLDF
ncbi:MAG: Lrp/AsnC family transcriptional regulator [Caulobacterales bacterium]|nr:Lrp/AsnC family transcriptional regulator [Caulobacterales bacterium]